MSIEDNKLLVRTMIEAFNSGYTASLKEALTNDYVSHLGNYPDMSREQFLSFTQEIRKSFPDFAFTIEDMVAEDDWVAVRFIATGTHQGVLQGIAPTHKQFRIAGLLMGKITNGKVSEDWESLDQLGQLQQLGIVAA